MQELIDQILYYARSAWRFRWLAMGTAWLVCVIGWAVLAVLPDVYEAKARVYVDTSSEISRLLDEQIIDPNIGEELAYVRQSMLGRVQMEKVATQTDLLLNASTVGERDAIINGLTNNININSAGGTRYSPDNLYSISYQNADPQVAELVVKTVLDIFIEDVLGGQQSSSETSEQFLLEQIAEYERRLREAEERLAAFNRENFDRLPGREGGYFERMQQESEGLEQTRQDLAQAISKRDRLKQQLRGETPWVSESGEPDPNSLEGRLQTHRIRLEELLLRFTENHPDVVATRETINRLEAQQEARAQDMADNPMAAASNNPVYQALQISINETEAEIATLQSNLANRQRKVSELRELIDEISDVEAQSARLNRDYGVIQAQYQSLIDSLERQRLSREASLSEEVEFRVIDPPKVDPNPVAPMRIAILPAILLVGFGIGAAGALLISQLKPVFQSQTMLEAFAGLPVNGSITFVSASGEKKPWRKGLGAFVACGLALVAVFAGVFWVEILGPGFASLRT